MTFVQKICMFNVDEIDYRKDNIIEQIKREWREIQRPSSFKQKMKLQTAK